MLKKTKKVYIYLSDNFLSLYREGNYIKIPFSLDDLDDLSKKLKNIYKKKIIADIIMDPNIYKMITVKQKPNLTNNYKHNSELLSDLYSELNLDEWSDLKTNHFLSFCTKISTHSPIYYLVSVKKFDILTIFIKNKPPRYAFRLLEKLLKII